MEEIKDAFDNLQPGNHALVSCFADDGNLLLQSRLPTTDQPVVQFDTGRPSDP
jgi:hypothetical protein